MDAIKQYANAIIAVVVLIFAGAILVERWHHGNIRYEEGRAEVQAAWDVAKAASKAEADKQAAETLKFNQEKANALEHAQAVIRDTRSNLNTALERLRDSKAVPWGEGMSMAGGGSTEAPVPSVAGDTGKPGIRVEQRIGSCEGYGADPCFVGRGFFDQALGDAIDRGLVRQWAAGQGIKVVKDAEDGR